MNTSLWRAGIFAFIVFGLWFVGNVQTQAKDSVQLKRQTALSSDTLVANDVHVSLFEDTSIQGYLSASSSVSNSLTFHIATPPAQGTVSIIAAPRISSVYSPTYLFTTTMIYTPARNDYGPVIFTYAVNNGLEDSNPATVTIDILPVNDPPTLDPIADRTVDENSGQHTINLTGITTGAANEEQPLTLIAQSSNPTLIPNPTITYANSKTTGQLFFTPQENQDGVATITVTVSDGQSEKSSFNQTVAIRVRSSIDWLYFPIISKPPVVIFNERVRYNMDIIDAPLAWNSYSGQGVVVAIVDTGVDLDHPDLQTNLVAGISFINGTTSPDDDQGHGSHVAGIVAGVANNGGIIGVAPQASMMPVKILDRSGKGTLLGEATGIVWAVDHGAKILNLSLGGPYNSFIERDAILYAYNRGVLMVAAAGNCGDTNYRLNGCDYQDQTSYPAAHAEVLAVASTNETDQQSSFSTQGDYIEVAAPGNNIFSTYTNGQYATISGSSQATPHVSGLAALIWSMNPTLTHEEVRAIIRTTVDDVETSGYDMQTGYGRINVARATEQITTRAQAVIGPTSMAKTSSDTLESPLARDEPTTFVPGEVLVKTLPQANITAILQQSGISLATEQPITAISQLGVHVIAVPVGQENATVAKLQESRDVVYAEPNYIVHLRD